MKLYFLCVCIWQSYEFGNYFIFICKLNKCFEVNGVRFHCRRKRYGKGSTRMNPVVELEWRYQWNSWLSYYSQKCVYECVCGLPISLLWDSFLEVIIYSTSPSQGPGLLEKNGCLYVWGRKKIWDEPESKVIPECGVVLKERWRNIKRA